MLISRKEWQVEIFGTSSLYNCAKTRWEHYLGKHKQALSLKWSFILRSKPHIKDKKKATHPLPCLSLFSSFAFGLPVEKNHQLDMLVHPTFFVYSFVFCAVTPFLKRTLTWFLLSLFFIRFDQLFATRLLCGSNTEQYCCRSWVTYQNINDRKSRQNENNKRH